jgi:hypothetical protein
MFGFPAKARRMGGETCGIGGMVRVRLTGRPSPSPAVLAPSEESSRLNAIRKSEDFSGRLTTRDGEH